MYQLIYWLGTFCKTISLLSLIILIPTNPYTKQLLTKGFLLLYINEIILLTIQSVVHMFTQPQLGEFYSLSQVIMNIYFIVIISIVSLWLVKYQQQQLSQRMTSMSIVVVVFVWMAIVTVGLIAIGTKQIANVRALGELAYASGWLLCLLKFILQYRLNTQSATFGLGFIFLSTNIAWTFCELLAKLFQQHYKNQQIAYNMTTIILTIFIGIACVVINIAMIKHRRQLLQRVRTIQKQNKKIQQQVGVAVTDSFIVDDRLMSDSDNLRKFSSATFNPRQKQYQKRQMYYDKGQQYEKEQQQQELNTSLHEGLLDKKQKRFTPSVATTKESFADSIQNY